MYTMTGQTDNNNALLDQHADLVKKLAYQMKSKLPPSVELDDLIQAGMMGLLDAVNKYEDGHGAQFETYAAQRIRGSMLDELRSADWLPRSIRKNMRDVESAISSLEQKLGRAPSEAEIAKNLSLSLEGYYDKLSHCAGHQLLYFEDFHEEGDHGEHFLDRFVKDNSHNPMEALEDQGFKHAIVDGIEALPERERLLMGLYYEQELNLKEIGEIMNVSESRVCQLHSQAVSRLRAMLKEQAWTGVA